MSRQRWTAITRALPVAGVGVLLLGVLTWPLLFTYSGFFSDWEHQLWLLWHQGRSIHAGHFPSLFVNSAYSVFYPNYAFYGGTLFAVTGTVSALLGQAPLQTYILAYVLDFAAAFGGWYWLSRMAGVNRWLALVPGLVFTTSAYYLLIVYVQGDWPEFTAISMIPLMLAAGICALRADRLRLRWAIPLAVSSMLFFGSHNITLLLGLTTIALTAVAVLALVPDARRQVTRGGLLRVGAIVVPAAMLSAWYLLPTLAYESHTRIGSSYAEARAGLKGTSSLVSFDHLFTLSRANAGPAYYQLYPFALSLPLLAILWVLAGIVILPRANRNRTWMRVLLICSALAALVLVVMTHVGLLMALPRQYTLIQFGYRLEAYILLLLSGAIVAALVLARGGGRSGRIWMWMAIPVCVASLVGALQQMGAYPYPGQDRYATLASYGEVETGNNQDFQDVTARVIPARNLARVTIAPESVQGDRASVVTSARPGTLVTTNIGAPAALVHVTGARPVGVDSETGDMVLAVAQPAAGQASQQTITVSTGHSLPIVLGRVLSLIGLAILALELVIVPAVRFLARRARAAPEPPQPAGAPAPAPEDVPGSELRPSARA